MQNCEPREVPFSSWASGGVNRRNFLKICCMAAAAVGLPPAAGLKAAEAAARGLKPSVI